MIIVHIGEPIPDEIPPLRFRPSVNKYDGVWQVFLHVFRSDEGYGDYIVVMRETWREVFDFTYALAVRPNPLVTLRQRPR